MEAGLKYGRLLKNPNFVSLDAEVTMAGPFVFLSFVMGYLIPVLALLTPLSVSFNSVFFANLTTILTFALLALTGAIMIYANKPRSVKSVLWLPFVYVYWFVQNFIAAFALLQIIFRRPRCWHRTKKTGKTDK